MFDQDIKCGNIHFKKGDTVYITIYGLQHNPSQWQRPHEFLPDRFDTSHPLSKTPSGEKRNTFAWLPFSGGRRVCFGKTFAEVMMKIVLSMMTQRFDFTFVDTEKFNKENLPQRNLHMFHHPKLLVQVRERAK